MASLAPREEGSNKKWCPSCSTSDNGQWILVLRQINAEEAVYVCDNPDCCYPVGFEVEFIKRPVAALNGKQEEAKQTKPEELDTTKSLGNTTVAGQLFKTSQPVVEVQASSHDVQEGYYEENHWNSVLDSMLDPEVAAYLDSVQ